MLENKKSLKFKRLYLLVATGGGLVFPFLDLRFLVEQNTITQTKQLVVNQIQNSVFVEQIPLLIQEQTSMLFILYVACAIVLGFRFLMNINKILHLKSSGEKIDNEYGTIVLHDKITHPFSFYDTIYLPVKQWNEEQIASEILYHEQGHLRQKHTLDILFVEFLKVFFWFQPFLYIMKRLMQENHEYLADEYSLAKTQDIRQYQQLILNFYKNPSDEMHLSSSFHFNNLKKTIYYDEKCKKRKSLANRFLLFNSAYYVFWFCGN